MKPLADFGWAIAIIVLLGAFWGAVEPRALETAEQGERALEARVLLLMNRYDHPDGVAIQMPTILVADWQGPGVAAASCSDWYIRVRPGAVSGLSDNALDELLAHELAHLLVCAEQGRRAAHDTEWWRVYRQLMVIG